jgi:hypothetical protein
MRWAKPLLLFSFACSEAKTAEKDGRSLTVDLAFRDPHFKGIFATK